MNLRLSFLFFILFLGFSHAEPELCTYTTYKWNVQERRAVDYKQVQKPYSEITDVERDSETGCSVCEEDQRWIQVGILKPVRVCHAYADSVEKTLNELIENGFMIKTLVGYRVGMTRGQADSEGNRTQFSNHSFGFALDINQDQNGLYDRCIEFGSQCRLRKGGRWHPKNEGSITADSQLVYELEELGFKWGGEIEGQQKDFMHFSPTGY